MVNSISISRNVTVAFIRQFWTPKTHSKRPRPTTRSQLPDNLSLEDFAHLKLSNDYQTTLQKNEIVLIVLGNTLKRHRKKCRKIAGIVIFATVHIYCSVLVVSYQYLFTKNATIRSGRDSERLKWSPTLLNLCETYRQCEKSQQTPAIPRRRKKKC